MQRAVGRHTEIRWLTRVDRQQWQHRWRRPRLFTGFRGLEPRRGVCLPPACLFSTIPDVGSSNPHMLCLAGVGEHHQQQQHLGLQKRLPP